jgi:hypothetical protein
MPSAKSAHERERERERERDSHIDTKRAQMRERERERRGGMSMFKGCTGEGGVEEEMAGLQVPLRKFDYSTVCWVNYICGTCYVYDCSLPWKPW